MSEKGPGLARKRFKVYKNQIHCMAKIAMTKRICQWFFVVNMGKTGRETLPASASGSRERVFRQPGE
jgi:hypothetical protein